MILMEDTRLLGAPVWYCSVRRTGDSTIVTFPFPEENLDAFCNGYFQLVKSRDNSLYIILVRVIDHSLRKIF